MFVGLFCSTHLLGLQSLPDITRKSGDDWDEFAAQRTAKMYADKAAKLEADMQQSRRAGGATLQATAAGPESDAPRATGVVSGAFKSPYELVQMERKKPAGTTTTGVPAFAHVTGGAL